MISFQGAGHLTVFKPRHSTYHHPEALTKCIDKMHRGGGGGGGGGGAGRVGGI